MPKVDLCFTFLGGQVPADHGDLLPAAVCRRPRGAEFAAECQQGGRAIEFPMRLGCLAGSPGDPHAGWFAGRIISRFPRPKRLQAFPRPGLAPGTWQSPPGYSPVLAPENRPRRRSPAGPERRPCSRLRRRARKQFAGARGASSIRASNAMWRAVQRGPKSIKDREFPSANSYPILRRVRPVASTEAEATGVDTLCNGAAVFQPRKLRDSAEETASRDSLQWGRVRRYWRR